MILQSLYALFNRLSEEPANGLPKPGYSLQNITFRVVLRSDGSLVEIQDARQEEIEIGKNGKEKRTLRTLSLLVPGQARPSEASFDSCLLWDDTRFVFGWHGVKEDVERNSKCFESFKRRHFELERDLADLDFSAVCSFLRGWKPSLAQNHPALLSAKKGRVIFQISGRTKYVHENESIRNWVGNNLASRSQDAVKGQCLVTGEEHQNLARLHPGIHGIPGSPYTGAGLVSFNLSAFSSFERDQGFNSPVGETAAFAYCNALNFLLASKNRRFRIGDATTVFWTDQPTPAEDLLPWMMSGVPDAEDDSTKKRVHHILEKISQGTLATDDLGTAETRYYILGLSLNQGRLSVRFWHTGTIAELVANLKLHFDHLRIVRQWDETNSKNPESHAPTAYQLLRQTSRDADGIPPLLGGALMRSILLGTRYPDTLINGVMNRIRVVEKNPRGEGSIDNVSYLRAAILKAWLIRNHNQTITTMLDETNTNPGYRLGRLFAVLEKTQQDAQPGINTTIRERFYSSASATPRAVFGRLLRTYQHHLAKLDTGAKIHREKQAQEILSSVSDFPAHLNLQNQAQFALGYYHQRKDFYTKKEAAPSPETTPQAV
jgi:CRISPR-associated protein Csd1